MWEGTNFPCPEGATNKAVAVGERLSDRTVGGGGGHCPPEVWLRGSGGIIVLTSLSSCSLLSFQCPVTGAELEGGATRTLQRSASRCVEQGGEWRTADLQWQMEDNQPTICAEEEKDKRNKHISNFQNAVLVPLHIYYYY